MTNIEENFTESIKRINFNFLNQELPMICLKNYDGFSLLNEKFGPFEKGKEYRLKVFKAIPFIENEILKVSDEEKCDNNIVQRHAIAERDNQKLARQDSSFFLNKIREFRRFIEIEINKGVRPHLAIDKYNSYIMSIVDIRLLKLLKLTKTELSIDDERRLTFSEQALFNKIYKLVKVWREFYLS